MTNNEIFQEVISTYGEKHQITKAIEELGELQIALARYLNGNGDFDNITEELADVDVVCNQLCLIFKNRANVLAIRQEKVFKLRKIVAAEKAKRIGVV